MRLVQLDQKLIGSLLVRDQCDCEGGEGLGWHRYFEVPQLAAILYIHGALQER